MGRLVGLFFAVVLMLSFCFVLPGLTQETKETEGVYTIKKGDTLWDISSKFLKDPFLWPKLWERNPYITNPHWIYPGNQIQLATVESVKKEEPPSAQPVKKEESQKAVEEKPQEAVKEPEARGPEVEKVESPSPPPVGKKQEEVAEAGPEVKSASVEAKKPVYFREIRSAGFMSDLEYRGIGIVLEGREGKNLMSEGDIVYLALRTSEAVSIGNKYTIFRAAEEIRHPITEKRIGRKYNIIGNVQLIDQHGNLFTAKVIESFDAVMVGDYIQPYSKEKMEGFLER